MLTLSLLGSCKKEKERALFIVMGDETDLLYTKNYKKIDGNYYHPEYFDIDFDGDGLMDLRLSRGLGNSVPSTAEARIESLHPSCKILGRTTSDTTFKHETGLFSTDPSGNDVYIHALTYSCEMESPDYVLDTVKSSFKLVATPINKEISVNDEYLNFSSSFGELSSSTYEPTGVVIQGVAYYDLITYYNDCSTFPKNEATYIGVKLYTYTGVKLGWVHLTVDSGNNIILKDWAIQE